MSDDLAQKLNRDGYLAVVAFLKNPDQEVATVEAWSETDDCPVVIVAEFSDVLRYLVSVEYGSEVISEMHSRCLASYAFIRRILDSELVFEHADVGFVFRIFLHSVRTFAASVENGISTPALPFAQVDSYLRCIEALDAYLLRSQPRSERSACAQS